MRVSQRLAVTHLATFASIAVAVLLMASSPVLAAQCGKTGAGFNAWLADYKTKAKSKGISQKTINRALSGVTYDPRVIRRDRSQKSFKLSFKQFYKRRVGAYLMKRGRARMKKYAGLLNRLEKRYGVPREVLISIWGLETNFGKDGSGKYSIIRSIATLAYDCRRSKFFTGHLNAALRIVQKGDMSPKQMRGGWAGEIGQVQFLPGSYDKYAVDYDGNGRRDLVRSVPDALASVANYLKAYGWQRGQPWGPGTNNYKAIKGWNRANVYARTIAVMATKL
ncbi:MAG: lytic murein transglycosylase [Pseudomonadota bacterium]